MNRQLIGQALLGLAVFFAGFGVAHAGSFSVNPVRVTLSAKQPVAAITVRNNAAEPAVVQLETSAWSQHQEKDVLVPTSEVLATPPIFTVAPGKTQILRVGLRRPAFAPETRMCSFRRSILRTPMAARLSAAATSPSTCFPATRDPGS